MELRNMEKKIISIFCVMILLQVSPHSAATINPIWEEDFSTDLNDWTLLGNNMTGTTLTESINSGFSIKDNTLVSGNNKINTNVSFAWHISSINYGTWKFDVFIGNWLSEPHDFVVDFMCTSPNGNYNFSGLTINDILTNLNVKPSGFYLWFSANVYTNKFIAFGGSNSTTADSQFKKALITDSSNSSLYNKFHTIQVTRALSGEFVIYFDQNSLFTYSDNSTVISQKFGIESWAGQTKIDNIFVYDQVIPPTSSHKSNSIPGYLWYFVPIALFLALERKRKNRH